MSKLPPPPTQNYGRPVVALLLLPSVALLTYGGVEPIFRLRFFHLAVTAKALFHLAVTAKAGRVVRRLSAC